MTNEKASIIVGNIPVYGDECYSIVEYQEAKTMAVQALLQEPKTGHWIEEPNGWVRCSCCSDHYPQTSYGAIGTRFCPHCGARMEV